MSIAIKKNGKYIQSLRDIPYEDIELIDESFRAYMECEHYTFLNRNDRAEIESFYNQFLYLWMSTYEHENGRGMRIVDDMVLGGFKILTDCIQGGHDNGDDWTDSQLNRLMELKQMISEACEIRHNLKVGDIKRYSQI